VTYHQELASGRWHSLTLAEQLGNVGSEFGRTLVANRQGNNERKEKAMMRFYELIDLTITDPRWAGPRRFELARLREQAAEEFEHPVSPQTSLQKYFDYFALVARTKS